MAVWLGGLLGLCGAISWSRAAWPKWSWPAALALLVTTAFGVWFALSHQADAQVRAASVAAITVMIIASPFASAHFLGEEPAFASDSLRNRLRFVVSPALRRAARLSEPTPR